jgi:serpin B
VDTHGTKAAAVSGFTYGGGRPKIEINLNRPFVYMIIDNSTNIPIFIGILNTVQ